MSDHFVHVFLFDFLNPEQTLCETAGSGRFYALIRRGHRFTDPAAVSVIIVLNRRLVRVLYDGLLKPKMLKIARDRRTG